MKESLIHKRSMAILPIILLTIEENPNGFYSRIN
mgnify:CR=1 FL=1|jgi:hypothetical protein